jgi:single-strand DNA-binding protein
MPNHALIVLTGHLGKDPELRTTQDGKSIANFSLAVKTGYGERETSTWYNCAAFGKTAEVVDKYLKKGMATNIIGEPSLRQYTTKDGAKGQSLDVAVQTVVLINQKQEKQDDDFHPQEKSKVEPPFDDGSDIPF